MDEHDLEAVESAVRSTLRRSAERAPLPPNFARQVSLALPDQARTPARSVLRPALAASVALLLIGLAALVIVRGSLPPGLTPTPSPAPTQQAAVATPSPDVSPTAEAPSPSPTRMPWTPKPPAPTMLTEHIDPPRLISEAAIDRIARELAASIYGAYDAGPGALEELFTADALRDATAADPLLERFGQASDAFSSNTKLWVGSSCGPVTCQMERPS